MLVEHARIEAARDLADQARPDHGAVRLVQERAERPRGLVRGIRRRRQLVRGLAADHERRPPHALAGERARPQHELDRRAVGADPLRLDVVGDERAVEARARA